MAAMVLAQLPEALAERLTVTKKSTPSAYFPQPADEALRGLDAPKEYTLDA
jgi:hypothetical protein